MSALAPLLVAAWGSPAASAASVVATSASPMNVRAYAGRVVWGELGANGWQLKTLDGGTPADLPISPIVADYRFFDVGPGEDGSPALVYSRCMRTAEGGTTDCDVFRYDFASRLETPVRSINTAGAIEALPSIWGRRIAFMRRTPGSRPPALYIAPSAGAGRAVRVGRGPGPGNVFVKSVELSRRGLFFVWLRGERDGKREQALYRIAHGRRTLVERRRYDSQSQFGNIGAPAVTGHDVFFSTTLRNGRFGARSVLVRRDLRSGRRATATPSAPFAHRGGVASIVPVRQGFWLETYPENSGPGLSDGNCFPAPADQRCQLLDAGRLRFRTG